MAGRPKHYQEEELIDKATHVFWKKGYASSSAKDLMDAMNIGQGSFYRTFPKGKKELYQKSLKRFLERVIRQYHQDLEESTDPIQFVKQFFFNIIERSIQEQQNGCYLGNTIMEASNLDKEIQVLSVSLLEQLKDGFRRAIEKAQAKGQFDATKSSETIAVYLINLWNGINITQRMYPQKEQLLEVLKLNLQILD